jgi:hypothetical protein
MGAALAETITGGDNALITPVTLCSVPWSLSGLRAAGNAGKRHRHVQLIQNVTGDMIQHLQESKLRKR